jgi:DNA polymerase III delta prime subunit
MTAQKQRLDRVIAGWQNRGHWPHALMLSGASTGVMIELALGLAKQRLCESQKTCGSCQSCRWFDGGNHLDFHLLASPPTAQEFGLRIDQEDDGTRRVIKKEVIASQLRRLALRSRVEGGWRVLLLVHPEELHTAAANALLKTLEEPGEAVFFILVSAQPRAVLETIISRCQQLNLPPPSRDELARKHLAAGEEQSNAITLAELERRGLLMGSEELSAMRIDAMSWLQAIAAGQEHGRLLALDRMNKASDPDRMMGLCLSLTLDLMRLQSGMQHQALTHSDLAEVLTPIAGAGPWLDLAQTIADARPALRRNLRIQTLLMGASL